MKLNLEVELDWIDEESNLDDTIKQNIIDSVVRKIQSSVESQVKGAIDKIINETTFSKINEMTEALFNDFTNREVTISDGYGSKIKVYPTVTDIIKERFDNFMTQKVDDKGKNHDGYGAKFARIEYIIDKQLKDFADKFTTDAVKSVSEEIKTHVKDGLTQKLGAELMNVLKVNKMLELDKSK